MSKAKESTSKSILIIDTGKEIASKISDANLADYKIHVADTEKKAMGILCKTHPFMILINMDDKNKSRRKQNVGLDILKNITMTDNLSKVIMFSDTYNHQDALKAIQLGALDYYVKPINLKEITIIIRRTSAICDFEKENQQLQEIENESSFYNIVGKCDAINKIYSIIRRVADTDTTVLVSGKSGTGKELVARAIHKYSRRGKNHFVIINCGAIPETLLESELFGHEKGSFTGASEQHIGKLEAANRGTVFLDEIGELPLILQVKLLRFLQDKHVERIGARKSIGIDTRIIAATNKNLRMEVDQGKFREDLFFRLSVVPITIPPLKDRKDDILLLAYFFLQRYSKDSRHKILGLSKELITFMLHYDWPGNIRELENRIRRGIIMSARKYLEPEDLGFNGECLVQGISLMEARINAEKELISHYLLKNQGHISKTAQELKISRPTFHNLLNKLKINPKEFKELKDKPPGPE